MFTEQEVDEVVRGYTEAALGSVSDRYGSPVEAIYDEDDIAPEALHRLRHDVRRFLGLCGDEIDAAMMFDDVREFARAARTNLYAVGHDFWFTRNRMGMGFWSRDAGFIGDHLTKRADGFGDAWLYAGEDGLIYISTEC